MKILVTSALPYANGPIHIGHLIEYIQTDIFVRALRLMGEDVIYCCADDTHGAPIEIKATELKITPEQLIEKFHKEHLQDFKDFLIKFDSYYTTNSPENKEFSDFFFNTLSKKGYIYKKEIEVTYCEHCKRCLPDRYVKGKCPRCGAQDQYGDVCEVCNATYTTTELIEPYCTLCGTTPTKKNSLHYFFKLSAFSEKLKEWLTTNKKLQKEVVNFVLNWIKSGLQDWCISRDGPYFGFKIPNEKNKYYYVWLDAPIGYIASTANYCKKHNLNVLDYWKNKTTRIIHFIGKDIVYFHFLFWPAMLMGVNFNLPDNIVVHGFLTVNSEKMSKSRGTFLTARDFLKKFDPEYLRFYYARLLSRKLQDIDLNFQDLKRIINNELVANLGNFCYRVLSYTNRYFNSIIEDFESDPIINEITKKVENIKLNYQNLNFNEAVKDILYISDLGNKYFQESEPWKLINKDKNQAHKIVGLCVNIVKILSILIQPILPRFSEELQKQLNLNNLKFENAKFDLKYHKINKAKILIKKIEDIAEIKNRFLLNLKVGKIVNVKDHPNADKLYLIDVNLGKEKRQLVAALKQFYKKDELINKNIIVVTNLKPAKIRGIESQGMLLAGDNGKMIGLVTTHAPPGTQIKVNNLEIETKQITIEEFLKIKLFAKNGKVVHEGKLLKADDKELIVERIKEGVIR